MIWWSKKPKPQKPQILRQKRRIPFMKRERAAYIKLRRVGLSINQISEAFGRSKSVVWKTIKKAEGLILRRFDLRTLPPTIRRRSASLRWQTLMKLLPLWEKWILGEGERPP